jgi:hypothetical protein
MVLDEDLVVEDGVEHVADDGRRRGAAPEGAKEGMFHELLHELKDRKGNGNLSEVAVGEGGTCEVIGEERKGRCMARPSGGKGEVRPSSLGKVEGASEDWEG